MHLMSRDPECCNVSQDDRIRNSMLVMTPDNKNLLDDQQLEFQREEKKAQASANEILGRRRRNNVDKLEALQKKRMPIVEGEFGSQPESKVVSARADDRRNNAKLLLRPAML